MAIHIRPQARLQRMIVFALIDAPAPSVVQLASRVDATRPAVSRALKSLAEHGLLERHGRQWSLTPAGRAEAAQLVEPFGPGVRRAIDRQFRVEREVAASVAWTSRGLLDSIPDIVAGMGALPAMAGLFQAKEALQLGPLMRAQEAVFDSLKLQMEVLSKPTGWITSVIADNMAATSRIAGDVAAMWGTISAPGLMTQGHAARLRGAVEAVVEAHRDHLRATLPELASGLADLGATGLIVTPTVASAGFTGAARAIASPTRSRDESVLDARAEELAEVLDLRGAHASAQAWRGAWAALRRGGPDHARMVAHEGREFLRLSLVAMAPDAQLSLLAGDRPTRRTRIGYIVGDSETLVELVDVLLSQWQVLYSTLSAEAHTDKQPRLGRQGLTGLLEAAGAVVRVLLDRASRREDA